MQIGETAGVLKSLRVLAPVSLVRYQQASDS